MHKYFNSAKGRNIYIQENVHIKIRRLLKVVKSQNHAVNFCSDLNDSNKKIFLLANKWQTVIL